MLKRRIIPVQLLIDGRLVKTVEFGSYRDVGDPVASSRVYNAQSADELVFLNINRGERTVAPMLALLDRVSAVTFMPLALGGGIRTLEDARQLILKGADKVVVNSVAYRDTNVVRAIKEEFGAQAVVVGLDVRWDAAAERHRLYSNCGRQLEAADLDEHVDAVVEAGAGELFVNSIDRDGMMNGYDIPLIDRVVRRAPVPVIGCGGAGHYHHLRDAFLETGVSALACGSLFNFGDSNPIRAKAFLSNHGIPFKVI
jgi:cyclase